MASKVKAKKVVAKKPAIKKRANGYVKSALIPMGAIFTDLTKKKWKVGPPIGSGGFGDIYSCCSVDTSIKKLDDYPFVIKIEPHANGPLFVEMHFYLRNAKKEDIVAFQNSRGLKFLGMPYLLGSGSEDLEGKKHRFIVMPRYGNDIWKMFLNNDRKMPLHTIYRLAIQMLNVLEFIHGTTYIHGDIKGTNILLGFGKKEAGNVYLVDYGLACHYTTKEFKPDPKKMHDGTIEYTSRDAHSGVPTMRSDLEILGYNLIQWAGVELPWVVEKLLHMPVKVQESKEKFMENVENSMQKLFNNKPPIGIVNFLKYMTALKYNDCPDYIKCRNIFEKELKALGKSNTGDLEFSFVSSSPNIIVKESSAKKTIKERSVRNSPLTQKRISEVFDEISPPRKLRRGKIAIEKTSLNDSGPVGVTANVTSKTLRISKKVSSQTDSKSKTGKKYELRVDLDASLVADVIVNVRKKRQSEKINEKLSNTDSPKEVNYDEDEDEDFVLTSSQTPSKRIKRKIKISPKVTVVRTGRKRKN